LSVLERTTTDLVAWPGRERREPPLSSGSFLHLHELARGLRDAIDEHFLGRADLRVLDVACGRKPYYPFFAPRARLYVGVDLGDRGLPDCRAPAEALPFRDGAFDAVVCTQAIAYFDSPPGAVREAYRVLRPNGRYLLSTHGLFPYMLDRWRYTQDGMFSLLAEAGFQDVVVQPHGGAVLTLCQLVALFLEAGFEGPSLAPLRPAVAGATALVNGAGLLVDRLLGGRGATFTSPNYLAIGRKPVVG